MLSYGLEDKILNVAFLALSTGLVQRSPQLITLPLREVVSRGRLRTEVVTDGSAGKASATALDCSALLPRFFVILNFIYCIAMAQIWGAFGNTQSIIFSNLDDLAKVNPFLNYNTFAP